MTLNRLDHVNIRTSNLEAMTRWYESVLGLESGDRPDFSFPGAWLYLGEFPIVHLVGVVDEPANDQPKIEHFAIQAEGYGNFIDHLDKHSVAYRTAIVPGFGIVQVNFYDPDGNHIHVDFSVEDAGDRLQP
jgi:catechol 2,3-dioxygenase-like lactoylglutathione lyase family enzyme